MNAKNSLTQFQSMGSSSSKNCCTELFADDFGDIPEETQQQKAKERYLKRKKVNIYRRGHKGLEVNYTYE